MMFLSLSIFQRMSLCPQIQVVKKSDSLGFPLVSQLRALRLSGCQDYFKMSGLRRSNSAFQIDSSEKQRLCYWIMFQNMKSVRER